MRGRTGRPRPQSAAHSKCPVQHCLFRVAPACLRIVLTPHATSEGHVHTHGSLGAGLTSRQSRRVSRDRPAVMYHCKRSFRRAPVRYPARNVRRVVNYIVPAYMWILNFIPCRIVAECRVLLFILLASCLLTDVLLISVGRSGECEGSSLSFYVAGVQRDVSCNAHGSCLHACLSVTCSAWQWRLEASLRVPPVTCTSKSGSLSLQLKV